MSLCMFLCGKYVLLITLLLVAKSIAVIPFLFDVSCRLKLPATGLKISSFPIFALKSPIIFVSRAGILYYFSLSLSYKEPITSLFSSVGACSRFI